MTFSKEHSAGFVANHMARLFAHGLARRIAPLGLAPAQFMVLLELWQEDGLTQHDLVTRLDVEQATMSNTLRRMERDGLIVRRAHDHDRRARRICLTDKARALQAAAIRAAQDQNETALASLSDAERAHLMALMHKVVGAMRRNWGD
ncbi:DNA-binding MarR family transcriptional regulator [Rhodovulum imhoffii]|uniref:DNA-binding MarR family transcriptional regulator n=1 Tax=Rhodovulum imhoffii TaxID=365340 RepID=A0A2T5BQQ0_9RHOB|nr:MarR family transcriptional regulator [Rhodovulum imhoffii]MBK5933879.1 MarR family transcriptional regulator [Rhodovulum imhoffii]PTN01533.1 DNA-binding MarR family transcriptional regulator [Rhodovulum imhoffii]